MRYKIEKIFKNPHSLNFQLLMGHSELFVFYD